MGKVVILIALLVQGIFAGQELELDDIGDNTTRNVKMARSASADSLETKEKILNPFYEHSIEENSEENLFDQESEEKIEPFNRLNAPDLSSTGDAPKSQESEVKSSTDGTSNLLPEEQICEHSTDENREICSHPESEESLKPNNPFTAPELVNTSDAPKSQDLEAESSIDKFLPISNLTPEDQISEIQAASKRLAQCIEREFASLESMITSGKRNKRDISEITGNKYLMRLLKHIRANNEHQNVAIDKMMSAREIAEMFGIDLTPDFESNEISFKPNDLSLAASEDVEKVSSELQKEDNVDKENIKPTNVIPAEQARIQNVFTQQYYYDTTPSVPQTSDESPVSGAYYYYQVDAPIASNTERPTFVQEPTQIHRTVEQSQNNESYQSTTGTYPEYATEQPAMTFFPQGTSERVNPFNYQDSSSPIIELVSIQAQEPVVTQEVCSNVMTEDFEEKLVSEGTTEQGSGLKVTHINRSSTYRFSHTSAVPNHQSKSNTLPQQYQYYFSLA